MFELAEALVALSPAELAEVPGDDGLHAEVLRVRSVRSHIAHKRELQFLAKQLRGLDDAELLRIRTALQRDRERARGDAIALHRLEAWRERLLEGGDAALAEFLETHPDADRQRLRQLQRRAQAERERGQPPRAFRELLRALRDSQVEATQQADDA